MNLGKDTLRSGLVKERRLNRTASVLKGWTHLCVFVCCKKFEMSWSGMVDRAFS